MNAYLITADGDHVVVVADSPDAAIRQARAKYLLYFDADAELAEPIREWNSEHFTSCALVGPVLEVSEPEEES